MIPLIQPEGKLTLSHNTILNFDGQFFFSHLGHNSKFYIPNNCISEFLEFISVPSGGRKLSFPDNWETTIERGTHRDPEFLVYSAKEKANNPMIYKACYFSQCYVPKIVEFVMKEFQ